MRSYTFTMKATVSVDIGAEVILSIAGHVARAMLSRYSHVWMEAKRQALDEIATPRVQPTRSARRKRNGTHRRSMRRWRSSRFAGNRWRAGKPIWIRSCSDGLLAYRGGHWQRLRQQRHRSRLPNNGFDSRWRYQVFIELRASVQHRPARATPQPKM